LLCDGSAVSRTDYADLYSVIGDTYGAGDGSTTFNLPNLTDKFIQGNATSGTEHSAGLPNITGESGNRFINSNNMANAGALTGWNTQSESIGLAGGTYPNAVVGGVEFNASWSNSIYGNSNTVQPPSVTMRFIIKY
jgi:microcystin-dependent protein